jgi:hypothetical protein
MSLIAQGETKATWSAVGSPSEATIERFSQFMGEIKRNGTALGHIVSAALTYSNNLDKVEVRIDGAVRFEWDPALLDRAQHSDMANTALSRIFKTCPCWGSSQRPTPPTA